MDEILDRTKLRYVLYARKSTDDPGRQIRSIDDQISECMVNAKRLGLNIVEVLKEKKSAKKPNQRPIFSQMLRDLKEGKYDGIIAWNPDRLARNMKEGGEIIDMVDEHQIVDMYFVTHHFSSDANGKMLLGIAFVLSKQYSDKLSQDVTRGVRRNFQEGKPLNDKHGYKKNKEGYFVPDPKNYELLRKGFDMRMAGESYNNIADFMNGNGYGRVLKLQIRYYQTYSKIRSTME